MTEALLQIKTWGNSLGVRIPSAVARAARLRANQPVKLLMQMVQKVLDGQKDLREDLREVKTRLGRLETDVAQLHLYMAEQSTSLDRVSDRLERVERRLDIVET